MLNISTMTDVGQEVNERNTTGRRGVDKKGIPDGDSVTCGRLSGVKLSQGALRDPLEHLLREDSQKLPANVQGFIHCPIVIGT